jgi:thymidylate synthase
MTYEHDYLDLLRFILDKGEDRADRTGTGTRSLFGVTLNIDLREGFPLLTTKKVPFKSVLSELLWFIEGSGDERRLAEILHGTRDFTKTTIWTANAKQTTGSSFSPTFNGDLGRIYGVQWRSWLSTRLIEYGDYLHHDDGRSSTYFGAKVVQTSVDQLADVIHKLKTNPTDRRIIMTAWNPGELDQMALPPCHSFVQLYLSNDRTLHAQMYQRSVDVGLGLPFNIASYALLVHMLAHIVGAKPGTLNMVLGDTHIYQDHFDAVKEQLKREPTSPPRLVINRQVTDIDDFKMEDFTLAGYEPQPHIAAKMSA